MHHFDYVQQNYNIGKYFHVTLLTQIKNTTRVLVKRKIIVISIKYKNIHSNNINKCTKINVLSLITLIKKTEYFTTFCTCILSFDLSLSNIINNNINKQNNMLHP